MKTGYTEDRRLLPDRLGEARPAAAAVGGARHQLRQRSRAQESQKLLNYGFQFYDTVRLYEKGQAVSTLRVWKGAANELKAGSPDDSTSSCRAAMRRSSRRTS